MGVKSSVSLFLILNRQTDNRFEKFFTLSSSFFPCIIYNLCKHRDHLLIGGHSIVNLITFYT